jgi:hypothetical protein
MQAQPAILNIFFMFFDFKIILLTNHHLPGWARLLLTEGYVASLF